MPGATIPFDFRPSSTQVVEAASYTVPANKYAYVYGYADFNTITIDGDLWLRSNVWRDTINTSPGSADVTLATIVYSGYYMIYCVNSAAIAVRPYNAAGALPVVAAATTATYANFVAPTTTPYPTVLGNRIFLGAGDELRSSTAGTYNFRLHGDLTITNNSGYIWAPTGTVIDATSGRLVVSEFDY